MIAASSLWMAALYSPEADPLRVYYGTDTRAARFLVGALLAMLWSPGAASQGSGRAASELLGWAGLLALMIFYTKFNEFQPLVYRGGILLTALASAVLIVGAASPGTLLSRLLETTVLRWVRSRSYSIYPWHWPVFMLTRPFEETVSDQVMKRLLAHGAERVIFINVHRPIGWEGYLHRIFVRAVPRWPQAELIDWDAIAHSEQGWFIEDQTHLSYAGSEAYVNAIKEKLKSSP